MTKLFRKTLSMALSFVLAFSALAFFLPVKTAHAQTADALAAYINGFDHGGSGTLSASKNPAGEVVVSGTVTGAAKALTLDLDEGVTVVWAADYSGPGTPGSPLVALTGDGSSGGSFFNFTGTIKATGASDAILGAGNKTVHLSVGGSASIASNAGSAIRLAGSQSSVTLAGGSILAASGTYAVDVSGAGSQIDVTGSVDISAPNGTSIRLSQSSSSMTIESGGVLNNNAGSMDNAGATTIAAGGTLNNHGTLKGSITNHGLINNHGGIVDGPVTNQGDGTVKSMTVGSQSASVMAGATGIARFSLVTSGIEDWSNTVDPSPPTAGIFQGVASIADDSGTLVVYTASTMPAGIYPLTITIGGVKSNTFYLVVSQNVTFTAEQVGGAEDTADSTGIKLTFDKDVAGLTASEITVTNGSGEAIKGTMVTGSGREWFIDLASVAAQGDISVSIADFNGNLAAPASVSVAVYKDKTPPPDPLVFAGSPAYNIPASTVGTAMAAIDVSGGVSGGEAPYTFAATGLPDGISISAAGVISGMPTTAGAAGTATITVTDDAGESRSITVAYGVISAAVNPLRISDLEAYLDGRLNQDGISHFVIWWESWKRNEPGKKDDGIISVTPDDKPDSDEAELEVRRTYIVAVRRLNIRAAAGTDSAKVGHLNRGDSIIAIGHPIEGRHGPWIKFELNGRIVYASRGEGKYLRPEM